MTLGSGQELNRKDDLDESVGLTGLTTLMVGQTRLNVAAAVECFEEVKSSSQRTPTCLRNSFDTSLHVKLISPLAVLLSIHFWGVGHILHLIKGTAIIHIKNIKSPAL